MTDIRLTTTLNRIKKHKPCRDRWATLLKGLGKTKPDDEPLPYSKIVEINGLYDALWAARAEPKYDKEWRLFACWCAREALIYTNDWRSVQVVQIAERYAHGAASDEQLAAAETAAWDAAWAAAWAARAAAQAAAWDAAWEAAWAAAWAAARDAADAADAVSNAVSNAARAAQTKKFLEIVGE
jgi:hypothetical protein